MIATLLAPLLSWPAGFQPISQRSKVNAQVGCKVGNAPILSLIYNDPVAPRVSTLLRPSCPSAVFWRVAAVWINSIQRQSVWALAHIRQKVLKQIPTLANLNSASAIALIARGRWGVAPRAHGLPSAIGSVLLARPPVSAFVSGNLPSLDRCGSSALLRAIAASTVPKPRGRHPHFYAAFVARDTNPRNLFHSLSSRRFPSFLQEHAVPM